MSEKPENQTSILIVEDEAIVALDVRRRVAQLGYTALESVSTGEEAVSSAVSEKPDLVLMDIQLTGRMDGIEAATRIREHTGIPVVFLTAFSDDKTLERAKVTDAFGYVLKPFKERELGIAIEMALYKERMQRRLNESREWLYGTVGAMFDGVVTTDADHTVLFLNERGAELTGWPESEAVGRHVGEVVRAETIPEADVTTGILPNAVRLFRRDGTTVYVEQRVNDIAGANVVEGRESAAHNTQGRVIVLREVSAILSYERELREARDKAQEAVKTKSEFLANVTHELRTPLNSILGMADLAHGLSQNVEQEEYLGILRGAAENLHGLISSILDLSRLDSGHIQLEEGEVDLDQLVESVVESFAVEAHGKGLSLRLLYDPEVSPYVLGDRARLSQVLSNLVANAVKYTEEGTVEVRVRPGRAPERHAEPASAPGESGEGNAFGGSVKPVEPIVVSVSDTGRGIPGSERETVFRPFTQLDGGSTRPYGGAGIGLAVADELVTLMGGRIMLESEEGRGSTFSVVLPLEKLEKTRELPPEGQRASAVALVGSAAQQRDVVEGWARYLGVQVMSFERESDTPQKLDPEPDVVLVGPELDITQFRRRGTRAANAGRMYVLRPLGAQVSFGAEKPADSREEPRNKSEKVLEDEPGESPQQQGPRYLFEPITPSALLRIFSGGGSAAEAGNTAATANDGQAPRAHESDERNAKAPRANGVEEGFPQSADPNPPSSETSESRSSGSPMLFELPVAEINSSHLVEIGSAAREKRKRRTSASRSGSRIDETLFRISLAARRGDVEAVRRLLSELRRMGDEH